MDIKEIDNEILKKENFTEAERQSLLAIVPPPDCYILQSSSCDIKTQKDFDKLYEDAHKAQKDYYDSHPIDQEKTARFEEVVKDVDEYNVDSKNFKEFEECVIEFINKSINEYLASDEYNPNEPKFVSFVLGLPGAGKSSTIKEIRRKHSCFKAEQDDFKTVISKHFGVDINHPDMHRLSGIAMKKYMIPTLLEKGISFTQEKIGDEPGKMLQLIQQYKEYGYDIDLALVHCPQDLAMKRNAMRCIDKAERGESPRCVERQSYKEIADRPLLTYLYLEKHFPDLVRQCGCYSSDINFSSSPQELLSLALHRGGNFYQQYQDYVSDGEQMRPIVERKFNDFVETNGYSEQFKQLTREDYNNIIQLILTKTLNPVNMYRQDGQRYDLAEFEKSADSIIVNACYKALEVLAKQNNMQQQSNDSQMSTDKVNSDDGRLI